MDRNNPKENVTLFLRFLSFDEKVSRNTVDAYNNDIVKFMRFIQEKKVKELKEIDRELVDSYVRRLRKIMKPTSVKRNISSLRKFFKYLKKKRLIEQENLVKFVQFGNTLKTYPEVLTVREVKSMTSAAENKGFLALRDRAMLLFLYSTGAKASEVCDAKISDLNLRRAVFVCNGGMGKRKIPFSREMIPVFRKYLRSRRRLLKEKEKMDSKYIFLNRSGKRLTRQSVYLIVRKYAEKADINKKVSPHTLRHSITSHLFFYGEVKLEDLKRIFGYTVTPLVLMRTVLPETRTNFIFLETHPVFRNE